MPMSVLTDDLLCPIIVHVGGSSRPGSQTSKSAVENILRAFNANA